MRLIDADTISYYYYRLLTTPNSIKIAVPKDKIEAMPIIDAVPVVRCKDCNYYDRSWFDKLEKNNNHYCPIIDSVTDINFFCAKGERRSENGKE